MAEISETALRAQLNARFRKVAADRGWLVDDVQREFALQQFTGRVFRSDVADVWVLIGGSALRIRTAEARPTGDADLATRGDIRRVTESLTGALQSRPGEPGEFVFTIKPTRWPGQYSGTFEYRLAGKRFANGAIDISTDRPITYEPDRLRPTPVVDLAALSELPLVRTYPVALHLAVL